MNENELKSLETLLFQTRSDFEAAKSFITHLEEENTHLRSIIAKLLDTIKCFGTNTKV